MSFEPSAERAVALDKRMRFRLADSLDYLFGEAGGPLGIDAGTARRIVADIRDRPQPPQRFGCYYDLVLALDRDDADGARTLAAEIAVPGKASSLRVEAIQDRPAVEADRCARLFLGDARRLRPVDAALRATAEARIGDALRLLKRGDPAMAAEIASLVREIVLATDAVDDATDVATHATTGAPRFHGASSFMLWGAILLNPHVQESVVDTAQALAHESGHSLLFGHSVDGPLVRNGEDERFPSPLRTDARTMDGVVHATFVVARMHRMLARLLAAAALDPGVLDAAAIVGARADLATHAANFRKGDRTVRDGASLTPTGRVVMDAARGYMASAG